MLLMSNKNHSRRISSIISGEREVIATHGMVVFVDEVVAAREMWQKTEDGHADGLQFLLRNMTALVLQIPEAACFEFAVENRSPTMA
jgi:hypothetical protein